jgi:hypothetical protein
MHFSPLQEDIQAVKVSDKAFFVYYLIRPVNWIRRRIFKKHNSKKIKGGF